MLSSNKEVAGGGATVVGPKMSASEGGLGGVGVDLFNCEIWGEATGEAVGLWLSV